MNQVKGVSLAWSLLLPHKDFFFFFFYRGLQRTLPWTASFVASILKTLTTYFGPGPKLLTWSYFLQNSRFINISSLTKNLLLWPSLMKLNSRPTLKMSCTQINLKLWRLCSLCTLQFIPFWFPFTVCTPTTPGIYFSLLCYLLSESSVVQ